MASLNLRWVEDKPRQTATRVPIDIVDSLTIIVGVSRLVEDQWPELSDHDRKELAAMLRRRANRLLTSLSEAAVVPL